MMHDQKNIKFNDISSVVTDLRLRFCMSHTQFVKNTRTKENKCVYTSVFINIFTSKIEHTIKFHWDIYIRD